MLWKPALGLIVTLSFANIVLAKDGNPRIALAVCDKVGLDRETRVAARNAVVSALRVARVDVDWTEVASGTTTTSFDPDSLEYCDLKSNDQILVIITRGMPEDWPADLMGLAPRTNGLHGRRSYILYDRVQLFASEHLARGYRKEDFGTLLGHLIAHELGHLLMPGQPHTLTGLMTGTWSRAQAVQAVSGGLSFGRHEAELIRKHVQARSAN